MAPVQALLGLFSMESLFRSARCHLTGRLLRSKAAAHPARTLKPRLGGRPACAGTRTCHSTRGTPRCAAWPSSSKRSGRPGPSVSACSSSLSRCCPASGRGEGSTTRPGGVPRACEVWLPCMPVHTHTVAERYQRQADTYANLHTAVVRTSAHAFTTAASSAGGWVGTRTTRAVRLALSSAFRSANLWHDGRQVASLRKPHPRAHGEGLGAGASGDAGDAALLPTSTRGPPVRQGTAAHQLHGWCSTGRPSSPLGGAKSRVVWRAFSAAARTHRSTDLPCLVIAKHPLSQSTDNPSDPLVESMRRDGTLLPLTWCANGSLVPEAEAGAPYDAFWGPLLSTDAAERAVAAIRQLAAAAAEQEASLVSPACWASWCSPSRRHVLSRRLSSTVSAALVLAWFNAAARTRRAHPRAARRPLGGRPPHFRWHRRATAGRRTPAVGPL